MKKKIICICLVFLMLSMGALGWKAYSSKKMPIPVLSFWGDISEMQSKSDVRNIVVTYSDGFRKVDGFAKIKVQGTSSLVYEKKNYTITFYEDEMFDKELFLDVGWGKQSKYCLKANWIDHTHARNVVTAKLVSEIQEEYGVLKQAPCNGAIDGFPIEIRINGDFLGLYTFNIPKDAWQFHMDENDPNHIVICGEGWDAANLFHGEPDFATWAVEVGEESEETLEKMKDLFSFVMNSSDDTFKEEFSRHIDMDAALNYYVISDFAYLIDNRGKNMLLATYDGVKWYLSLYDLDTSWGTDWQGTEVYDYQNTPVSLAANYLFERMEKCFAKEIAQRYFELKESKLLTKAHIMNLFGNFNMKIPEDTFAKEKERWGWEIPGFYYEQIEEFLDYTTVYADQKYKKMLDES